MSAEGCSGVETRVVRVQRTVNSWPASGRRLRCSSGAAGHAWSGAAWADASVERCRRRRRSRLPLPRLPGGRRGVRRQHRFGPSEEGDPAQDESPAGCSLLGRLAAAPRAPSAEPLPPSWVPIRAVCRRSCSLLPKSPGPRRLRRRRRVQVRDRAVFGRGRLSAVQPATSLDRAEPLARCLEQLRDARGCTPQPTGSNDPDFLSASRGRR